jgi:hypothetical protein
MMKGPQQYGFSGPQQEATSAAFILLPGERRRHDRFPRHLGQLGIGPLRLIELLGENAATSFSPRVCGIPFRCPIVVAPRDAVV